MDEQKNNSEKISIAGLGKIGLPLAASFASQNFKVLGLDINSANVEAINNGISPIIEKDLPNFIKQFHDNLEATLDYQRVINETDITFVIVATPSDLEGHFSNNDVESALKPLAQSLRNSSKPYHLFVISSTLMPGVTEQSLIPLIEEMSGRKLNIGFGMCYVPEFVALGNAINDFLNPDLVLIGESSSSAGDQVEKIYLKFCKNNPCVIRMSIISAEIAKISLNSYVTMKISFANTLANICEKVPSANVDDITKALGADKRVSPYYLKGGLAFGGPCFPRDGKAFAKFANNYSIDAKLVKATDYINQNQIKRIEDKIEKNLELSKTKLVAILGLAYKPDVPLVDDSPSLKIIDELLKKEIKVVVYDGLAETAVRSIFGGKIEYASSVKNCFEKSDLCVIATPNAEFYKIDQNYIIHNPTTIIDCWRIINPDFFRDKVNYIGVGQHKNENNK